MLLGLLIFAYTGAQAQYWSELDRAPAKSILGDQSSIHTDDRGTTVLYVQPDNRLRLVRLNDAGDVLQTQLIGEQTRELSGKLVTVGDKCYFFGESYQARPFDFTLGSITTDKKLEFYAIDYTLGLEILARQDPSVITQFTPNIQGYGPLDEGYLYTASDDGVIYQLSLNWRYDSPDDNIDSPKDVVYGLTTYDIGTGEIVQRDLTEGDIDDSSYNYFRSLVASDDALFISGFNNLAVNNVDQFYATHQLELSGIVRRTDPIDEKNDYIATPRALRNGAFVYTASLLAISANSFGYQARFEKRDLDMNLLSHVDIVEDYYVHTQKGLSAAAQGGVYYAFRSIRDSEAATLLMKRNDDLSEAWRQSLPTTSPYVIVQSTEDGGVIAIWTEIISNLSVLRLVRYDAQGQITSSIDHPVTQSGYFLGPNPVGRALRFDPALFDVEQSLWVELHTITGQRAFAKTLTSAVVDLPTDIVAGAYVLTVKDEQGQVLEATRVLLE